MMAALVAMAPTSDIADNLVIGKLYLVYSKARQESVAARGLRERGYVVYLPKLRQRRRVRGRLVDVTDALFRRYLFLAPGRVGQAIAPVDSTPSVQKLIRLGALYLPVGEGVIRLARTQKAAAIACSWQPIARYSSIAACSRRAGTVRITN